MYDPLFNYIERYSDVELLTCEKERVASIMKPKKLRRRQLFLEEGKICAYTGFILKGAARQFTIPENGTECINQLCIENWWITDRDSFINRIPSIYYIEAWEDTDLLVFQRQDLEVLLKIPAIQRMFWKMSENNQIASQKRLDAAISLNALQRYERFLRCYPEIAQRFPLHHIASYLGVSKETLSRVRKPRVK
ncbi:MULTISPECIES: Crp/Fnr family transcriptional regulator [Bacteroidota]|jgi:CRP-like cAMP-binding protein|uniref:cAMP-binding domain of CRP or a regulatory subunit of cAMP-dependent protein kinases n=1 Tax=Chryseobacterium arachidis TaxID=1416778 RepID=A0A1M5L1H1_9FLAO|nr:MULTISPECIES: Crp/Fnr family transcriptional regulator [Bacteroidota]MCS4168458.1 CRP-like cAMP-binding protein [Sphingobacterium sp. BIGb0116]SHG58836.1 cAMP-binding domain of CRP or a regulatory subunit of cAMP-dependent protein kinases [Chryseobacterium arachidis]